MKEIIKGMPAHRNWRRIMWECRPPSPIGYARNLRRVPSFLFYGHRIDTCGASVICREIHSALGVSCRQPSLNVQRRFARRPETIIPVESEGVWTGLPKLRVANAVLGA